MRKLLFITSSFPYYPGEQFIETEISFLAESFDSVYVVPLGGDETRPRPVPSNVYVIDDVREFRKRNKRNPLSRLMALGKTRHALREEIVARKNILLTRPKAFKNLFLTASGAGQIAPLIENIILRYKPSAIYSYWLSIGAVAAYLATQNLESSVPVISRCHGYDLYEERHTPRYCPLQRFLVSHIDAVLPISDNGRNYLGQKYQGTIKGDLKTFRLGVARGHRATLSHDGILRIVSCSFLNPVKRVHLIMEALKLLSFPISWTHIGDGPLRKTLEEKKTSLVKEHENIQVHFAGNLPNSKVLEFYESNPVDLFINVSSSEGIPVSIMEAASRGIPVIATNVGGTSEIVNETIGSGFLLPENVTPSDIAERLNTFYNLPQKAKEEMRDAAFHAWENDFSAEKNYREFCRYLLSLIMPDADQA